MNDEKRLYLHRLLNEFADGLIKVFIPLIIYEQTNSLLACLGFVLGYYALQSLGNYFLYKYMAKNPILFLWMRIAPVLSTQLLLLSQSGENWVIYGFIISYSFSNIFYWAPLNMLFAKIASHQTGEKTGKFRAASIGGRLLAPLLSGFILTYLDISYLVFIAIVLYLSAISVFFTFDFSKIKKQIGIHQDFTSPTPLKNNSPNPLSIKSFQWKLFLPVYVLIGIFNTSEIFWSLYIYDISINFFYVGIATTFIQIGVLFSNLISGKITDKRRWLYPASLALCLFSITWLLRGHIEAPILIFLISGIAGLFNPIFIVPFFSHFIQAANQSGVPQKWIALREIAIKTGGFILVGVIALGSYPLTLAFYTSSVAGFVLIRLARKVYTLK